MKKVLSIAIYAFFALAAIMFEVTMDWKAAVRPFGDSIFVQGLAGTVLLLAISGAFLGTAMAIIKKINDRMSR